MASLNFSPVKCHECGADMESDVVNLLEVLGDKVSITCKACIDKAGGPLAYYKQRMAVINAAKDPT